MGKAMSHFLSQFILNPVTSKAPVVHTYTPNASQISMEDRNLIPSGTRTAE